MERTIHLIGVNRSKAMEVISAEISKIKATGLDIRTTETDGVHFGNGREYRAFYHYFGIGRNISVGMSSVVKKDTDFGDFFITVNW